MKKGTLIIKILKYLKSDYLSIAIIILLSLISVAFGAALPYFVGIATENTINSFVESGSVDFNQLYQILLICLFVGIVSPLISWIISIMASSTSYRFCVKLRNDVFNKIHDLELKVIDTKQQGELSTLLINDIELVIDGFTHLFTMLFVSILTIIACLIMMFILHYLLAIVVVVIAIFALLATQVLSRKAFKAMLKAMEDTSNYYAFSNEMINESKIVSNYNYEEIANSRSDEIDNRLRKSREKAMFISSLTNPVCRLFNNLIYVSVGLIGGLSYINGGSNAISIGTITSLLLYATQFAKPLTELSNITTEVQNALVACQRIFEFLEISENKLDKELPNLTKADGNVLFSHVYFQYVKDRPLIEDFNLQVKSGQVIAIVGPTGAGKSTLVNLLMRFYNLDDGTIYLDDNNVDLYSKNSVRKHFGMVLQDTWLKQASIKDNLLYGNNASEEEMYKIAKQCMVHELIMHLPEGYDTIIKEHSYIVSQGEKQLLTIARAMLANPQILILDEATSAIDTRMELLIQEALENIMKEKTTFVIAHRLSTIVNADKIIVLNNGKVIEVGNHNELMKNEGFYYQLYNSQFAFNAK